MAACCRDGKSFILSNDENIFEIGSDSYLGIVKPNFTGTTFKCLDYGIDPSLFPGDGLANSKAIEHASIVYVTNVLGRVPNAMTVVIPKINITQSGLSEEETKREMIKKPDGEDKTNINPFLSNFILLHPYFSSVIYFLNVHCNFQKIYDRHFCLKQNNNNYYYMDLKQHLVNLFQEYI